MSRIKKHPITIGDKDKKNSILIIFFVSKVIFNFNNESRKTLPAIEIINI